MTSSAVLVVGCNTSEYISSIMETLPTTVWNPLDHVLLFRHRGPRSLLDVCHHRRERESREGVSCVPRVYHRSIRRLAGADRVCPGASYTDTSDIFGENKAALHLAFFRGIVCHIIGLQEHKFQKYTTSKPFPRIGRNVLKWALCCESQKCTSPVEHVVCIGSPRSS